MARELWSTGISVHFGDGGHRGGQQFYGWWAEMTYTTGGHCESGVVEGTIDTRYAEESLAVAIDYVLEVAQQFGIKLGLPEHELSFSLYYKGDGEWRDYPAPDGWRLTLAAEAARRGWTTYDHWDEPPKLDANPTPS